MTEPSPIEPIIELIRKWSFRAKLLVSVWVLFGLLVLAGIHGSSTGVTADWWAPERPYDGYLLNVAKSQHKASRIDWKGLQHFLMGDAKMARWDELAVGTPYALSQLSHSPRFPVVNTNIGAGQNMLISSHTPVLHISTLARPATWGYFVLGAQRGLAWYWWFQVFACFTVLFLLFEILAPGRTLLAAFGAFWFCASAYTVCWSLWPAHFAFFAVLACLSAYHLFKSAAKRTQIIAAILLGLSLAGFVMLLYPAWQVQLGYLTLLLFAGLVVRDRLYQTAREMFVHRLACLGIAIVIAAGILIAWFVSCLPDLKLMSNAIYPGRRVALGGDMHFALLFRGIYNLITIYFFPQALENQSQASSFYYFWPAVIVGVIVSRRMLRGIGVVGWLMLSYIVAMLIFLFIGFAAPLSKLTLMSYVTTARADLGLGLASIILSLLVLAEARTVIAEGGPRDRRMPIITAAIVTLLLLVNSLYLMQFTGEFPPPSYALLMSMVMGAASFLLLSGRMNAFCATVGLLVIATAALFNPLSTNLDHIYDSELAHAIQQINLRSQEKPLWITYGGNHVGVLVSILGGRSVQGIQFPPQFSIWHALDPGGAEEDKYNRYAEVFYWFPKDESQIVFTNTREGALRVDVSPNNPALRSIGVRYVILFGDAQKAFNPEKLTPVYNSVYGNFSIYEIT